MMNYLDNLPDTQHSYIILKLKNQSFISKKY